MRFEILKRDGFKCRYCGVTAFESLLQIDHVIPVSQGGDNSPDNLATACKDCNGGKSDIHLDESELGDGVDMGAAREHAAQVRELLAAAREVKEAQDEYVSFVLAEFKTRVFALPKDSLPALRSVIRIHTFAEMCNAMDATAIKKSQQNMTPYNAVLYFFGVLRRIRERSAA